MSSRPAEERIRDLVADLRPVRRIPPLRVALAWTVLPWLVVVSLAWSLGRSRPRALGDPFWSSPFALSILAGLLAVGLGSTAAALASAVPDRARAMQWGLVSCAIGASIAVGGALLQLSGSLPAADPGWWRGSLACLSHAVGLGLVTGFVALRFVGAAAMWRPRASATLAVAGAVALGAGVVHASCRAGETYHQLVAHALAPAIVAGLLSIPLGLAMRRLYGVALSE
ncbi:MAG: hypothetical protein U0900_15400 [Myxococcota bacterium]